MIKFFRKIRQTLLSENKISKYLLYAIGEIVLVVIGILIALQVNNANEQRAQDREAHKILTQIQDELLHAIITIDRQRASYRKKDSIYNIIMSDTLTKDFYMDRRNFQVHRMTYTYHPIRIQKEGFKSFIDQADGFSDRYSDLVTQLKSLYLEYDFYINDTQNTVKAIVDEQYDYAKTQSWYTSVWSSRNKSPEFAEYLLHNYIYKNQVEAYMMYVGALMGVCTKFQKDAIDLYKELHEITAYPEVLPEIITTYYVKQPQRFIDQLTGVYQPTDSTSTLSITIEMRDDQLYLNDEKAYLIKNDQIISVLEYPTATLWKYNLKDRELRYNQLMTRKNKFQKTSD